MSLLPMLFSNWWEELEKPHRLFDQYFGSPLSPEDLPVAMSPGEGEIVVFRPRRRNYRRFRAYDRNPAESSSGLSTVKADKNKFQVTLDVQQFAPEEISVKVVDKKVVIEGKHEEKQDEHGWISRQFVRKYLVPEQCDIDELKTTLSSDGVLTVTAPRKEPEAGQKNERIIKIQTTGKPAIREDVESNEKKKEQDTDVQKNSPQQRKKDHTVKAA